MTTTKERTHTLQVGDILHASWGYDQTNATFYQVTALNGRTMVTVEQIGKRLAQGDEGRGVLPVPDTFYRFPDWHPQAGGRNGLRRKVHGNGVRINSYMWATKCDPTDAKFDTIALGYPGH